VQELFRVLEAYESHEGELSAESRAALAAVKQQADLAFMRNDAGNLLTESMSGLLRVKRIVQDLKDFSHVDKQEMQLADLERGLDSTLNIVWNELKYKAEVIKEYQGIPKVRCILAQLNQVFMNLLINAAQAIDEHGRIVIRTGESDKEVWVEIEDSGKGIPAENLDRIFDPFFTTKPVGSGTGLGLSLSYGIVRDHGGRIEVKSEVGKGSTFRVVLPKETKAE
jgi:signal transduction histidine kinase